MTSHTPNRSHRSYLIVKVVIKQIRDGPDAQPDDIREDDDD